MTLHPLTHPYQTHMFSCFKLSLQHYLPQSDKKHLTANNIYFTIKTYLLNRNLNFLPDLWWWYVLYK